jgi:hypothetical protein
MATARTALRSQDIGKRDYHVNPNDILRFAQPEYKGFAKRHRPSDQDPFLPIRVPGYTSNLETYKNNAKNALPVTPRNDDVSVSNQYTRIKKSANVSFKEKDLNYVKLDHIKADDEPDQLRRKLNRVGISPVKIRYDRNPITHENIGTGMLIVDWGKQDRTTKTIDNLNKLGYEARQLSKLQERFQGK